MAQESLLSRILLEVAGKVIVEAGTHILGLRVGGGERGSSTVMSNGDFWEDRIIPVDSSGHEEALLNTDRQTQEFRRKMEKRLPEIARQWEFLEHGTAANAKKLVFDYLAAIPPRGDDLLERAVHSWNMFLATAAIAEAPVDKLIADLVEVRDIGVDSYVSTQVALGDFLTPREFMRIANLSDDEILRRFQSQYG